MKLPREVELELAGGVHELLLGVLDEDGVLELDEDGVLELVGHPCVQLVAVPLCGEPEVLPHELYPWNTPTWQELVQRWNFSVIVLFGVQLVLLGGVLEHPAVHPVSVPLWGEPEVLPHELYPWNTPTWQTLVEQYWNFSVIVLLGVQLVGGGV